MVKISNNGLAALLLVAIAISGMGVFTIITITTPTAKITGAASGVTNLTISSLASITLLRNVSEFGSGAPSAGSTLHLYTNTTNDNGFNNGSEGNGTVYGTGTHVYPFVVENDGNDDSTCVKVHGDPAATFIGGSNPVFEVAAQNNETASCVTMHPEWQTVSGVDVNVCEALHTEAGGTGANTVRIYWHLGIPQDASAGAKINTIVVTGQGTC